MLVPPKLSYGLSLDVGVTCTFTTCLAQAYDMLSQATTNATFYPHRGTFSFQPSTAMGTVVLGCGVLHFTVSVRQLSYAQLQAYFSARGQSSSKA